MEESGMDYQPLRLVKRKNARGGGVVPINPPSKTPQIASKAMVAAAAAGLLFGGAKVIDNTTGAEAAGDQAHVSIVSEPEVQKATVREASVETGEYFDEVFHDLDPAQKMKDQAEVAKFKQRILNKPGYQEEHLDIPFQYKDIIEQTTTAYGISVDTLMGLIGTENGGGTDKINSNSGARGVAQFMPNTAGDYGLKIGGGIDQRADPVLSIDAAGRYLRNTKALFGGDEGMALWSYHAGPGNVFTALEIYFKDVDHYDIGNYGEALQNNDPAKLQKIEREVKERISNHKLDISKLLSNPKVMEFTATLNDYSETYPATVVAMSQIIKEHEKQHPIHDLGGGLRVSIGDKPGSNPLSR